MNRAKCPDVYCTCQLTDDAIEQAIREQNLDAPEETFFGVLCRALLWAVVFAECLIIYGSRTPSLFGIMQTYRSYLGF